MFQMKAPESAPSLPPLPIRPAAHRRHTRCRSFGSADYIPEPISLRERLSSKNGVKMVAKSVLTTSYFCQTANPDPSSDEEEERRAISKAMHRERKRRKMASKQLEGPKESSSFRPRLFCNWSWLGTSTAGSCKVQGHTTKSEGDRPQKQYGLKGADGLATRRKKTVRVKISTLPDEDLTNVFPTTNEDLIEIWRNASPVVLRHYTKSSTSLVWNGIAWTRTKEELVEGLGLEERSKNTQESMESSLWPEGEIASLELRRKAQCEKWISSITSELPPYTSSSDTNVEASLSAPALGTASQVPETSSISRVVSPYTETGAERSTIPLTSSTTPSGKHQTQRPPSLFSTASTLATPVYPFMTTRPTRRSSSSSLHPCFLSAPTKTPSEPSSTSSIAPSHPSARITKDSLEYAIRKDRARVQLKKEREEERAKVKMRQRMKMGGVTYNMQTLTREERVLVYKVQKEERQKDAIARNSASVALDPTGFHSTRPA